MVTVLRLVGTGQEEETLVEALFQVAGWKGRPNYPAAEPWPLVLAKCYYPSLVLRPDMTNHVFNYSHYMVQY